MISIETFLLLILIFKYFALTLIWIIVVGSLRLALRSISWDAQYCSFAIWDGPFGHASSTPWSTWTYDAVDDARLHCWCYQWDFHDRCHARQQEFDSNFGVLSMLMNGVNRSDVSVRIWPVIMSERRWRCWWDLSLDIYFTKRLNYLRRGQRNCKTSSFMLGHFRGYFVINTTTWGIVEFIFWSRFAISTIQFQDFDCIQFEYFYYFIVSLSFSSRLQFGCVISSDGNLCRYVDECVKLILSFGLLQRFAMSKCH